jgi:hypothetical protein
MLPKGGCAFITQQTTSRVARFRRDNAAMMQRCMALLLALLAFSSIDVAAQTAPTDQPVVRVIADGKTPITLDHAALAAMPRVNVTASAHHEPPSQWQGTDCPLTWHGITCTVRMTSASAGSATAYRKTAITMKANRWSTETAINSIPHRAEQPAADGSGHQGQGRVSAGLVRVFNASTGINPQSGLLANASATKTINNGLPRAAIRSPSTARARANPSMTNIYGGISSTHFGTLTFGRQRALGTDAMLALRSGRRRLCLFVHRL